VSAPQPFQRRGLLVCSEGLTAIADEPEQPAKQGELATVTILATGDIVVATVAGELDRSNASPLLLSLGQAVPNSALGLIIDCAELVYVDSAGVYVLFTLAGRLAAHQQKLALVVSPASHVQQVLDLSQMQQMAGVFATVTDATAWLRD
jgi:anti-anti-sigma factor